jgi:hypothetical protein
MRQVRAKVGGGLGGLILVLTLVACGTEAEATSRPQNIGTAVATIGTDGTATPSRPGLGGPPATPAFQRPTGTITPIFERPTGTIFVRPTGSPDLPIIGGQPTVTPSANAVAPNSDGTCPATHPIKASQLGPVKSYFLSDHAAYTRTRAVECFATEAEAEAAGYRKAAR